MPQNVMTGAGYAKLVKDIRQLIEEGKARAQAAAGHELVQTYWMVGKRISEEGLTENAGYGQAVLDDLSEELLIDRSTLQRCIYFFQTYNSATSSTNLTWSHYKYLLSINDDAERKWYEDSVDQEKWTVLQLGNAIKEKRYRKSAKGGTSSTETLKRPAKATYVYKAVVERVIDGDTLLLKIDLGFQVWKEQRIRLAGIDTPAMDEPGGQEAYRFVLAQLAKADFVMVKTNKIDVYGRYVGHLFYSLKGLSKSAVFAEGTYLNQELVDQGWARMI